jgi:hypothetical protein
MEPTVGSVFGSLTVTAIAPVRRDPGGKRVRLVEVQCRCGRTEPYLVRWANVLHGHSRSCGCSRLKPRQRRDAMKGPAHENATQTAHL